MTQSPFRRETIRTYVGRRGRPVDAVQKQPVAHQVPSVCQNRRLWGMKSLPAARAERLLSDQLADLCRSVDADGVAPIAVINCGRTALPLDWQPSGRRMPNVSLDYDNCWTQVGFGGAEPRTETRSEASMHQSTIQTRTNGDRRNLCPQRRVWDSCFCDQEVRHGFQAKDSWCGERQQGESRADWYGCSIRARPFRRGSHPSRRALRGVRAARGFWREARAGAKDLLSITSARANRGGDLLSGCARCDREHRPNR